MPSVPRIMTHARLLWFASLLLALSLSQPVSAAESLYSGRRPIKALLITGGCCHNYAFQAQALTTGISKVANVEWTILQESNTTTRAQISLYNNPNWAKPYDVIIHNECFADTDNHDYVQRITAAHRAGKPAMVIHCAMHTYRAAQFDDWREMLGVTSRRHDHMSRYPVRPVALDHPIMKGFPAAWTTPMDELYIIEKLWPGAKALAVSKSEKDGQEQPVIWVNQYGKTRVFGTTYGHSDDTFRDPVYINLLARGLVWSVGKLK